MWRSIVVASLRIVFVVVSSASLATARAQAPALKNGDFETKATGKEEVAGFSVSLGAQNGAASPPSDVVLDAKVKHGGKCSLRLAGDETTRGWRVVEQAIPVRPGATYTFTGFTKAKDVKPGFVKGTKIAHFQNCHVGIFLSDGNGEIVAKDMVTPDLPTADWKEFRLSVKAPDSTRKAIVNFFLSMPGELWVDDLALKIEGGGPSPEAKPVFREDFAHETTLAAAWKKEIGARNGDGGKDAVIAIDPAEGSSAASPRSLKFSGDADTIRWYTLGRTFPAAPGNLFHLKAKVKAKEVRKQGIQFPNLHLSLLFLDKSGNTVGVPRFASPGDGTYDWKDVEVSAVAPLDAATVRLGIFLSMSGEVWIDDLELTLDTGAEPPYAKWQKKDTKHLTLRFSPDPGVAAAIPELAKRMDAAYEEIKKALAVDYDDRITIYVYKDGDEGQRLVGRELDFAEPDSRMVHQTIHSTLSHEMTHCIARAIGYAQTGLLGEGVAVYFNGAKPEETHRAAASLLAAGKLPSVDSMLKDFRKQENGYAAAGSFCGFVIETYGIEKFKRLYLQTDPAAVAQDVLGAPLDEVEKSWLAKLKTP
jgi:hypothetical protein